MKAFTLFAGPVASDSTFPAWNAVLPSILDYNLISFGDTMATNVQVGMNGRALPIGSARTWTASSQIQIYPDGYAAPNSTASTYLASVGIGSVNSECSCSIENVGDTSSACGLTARYTNSGSPFWMGRISFASNLVILQTANVSGGPTYQAPLVTNAGDVHTMRLKLDGTTIGLYVDDTVAIEIDDPGLSTGTGVGLRWVNSQSRIHNWYGRAL